MRIRELITMASVLAIGAVLPGAAQNAPTKPAVVEGPGSTISQAPRPASGRSSKLPYGLQLMAHFELLPKLRDTKCVQDSSYDRSGGNGDAGHFLRVEGNKAILSDIRGPGCIYRFWSANAAGQLRIYFDGETKPRIDCPMQDLFLGKVAPFVSPIVGHKSGGWYCFFPMPFAKGCRIEVTNPGSMYYHVEYQLFPDRTPVRTFTPTLTAEDQSALDTILAQWNHRGSDPKTSTTANKELTASTTLAPGATQTIATLKGPAEINQFRFKFGTADRYTLRQTLLRVYWDDAKKPAIEAPVGDFFGVGFGEHRFAALPTAMAETGYSCYWPMPFNRSARFELVNTGQTALAGIYAAISYTPKNKPQPDAGYFHAQWHRETTVSGKPYTILKATGRGHYVGEHTDMQGDRNIGFLEGDEKVYVDGETFPSIYGTGTEDFYTGGWYFDEGPFDLAYHGCTVKNDVFSRVAAYRYQIQDCIPFQKSFEINIEHGGENDYPGADYSSVAYWYQTVPEHDWSPIDVAQLTPAHIKIGGVMEAENLHWTQGKADVQEDRLLPEEASGGQVVALNAGDHTFQFDVKTDDVYTVVLQQPVAPGSVRIKSHWWVDAGQPSATDLAKDEGVLGKTDRNTTERNLRLTPGGHALTIHVPEGKTAYLDFVNLVPSRKEKNVIEAETLVDKAETAGKGTVSRRDADFEWSGGGALVWKPTSDGATVTIPVSVPIDADYALDLGITPQPNGPIVTARVDGETVEGAVDTYAPKLDGAHASVRMPVGQMKGLTRGVHVLTLTLHGKNPAVMQPELWLDYIAFRKSLYANSYEAESLTVLDSKAGQPTHQETTPFGAGWSNDDQFWFLGSQAGAEATLELPVPKAGRYELSAYYTTSRDYAIVQVLLDGKPVGPATDTYSVPVLPKGKTTLGSVELTAGPHRITFRAVGKNSASSGYFIGVDAIGLVPLK